jgi:hypothetical protein
VLVAAEPGGISVIELRRTDRRQIAIPSVQAVAAFADQLWIATRTGLLIRLGIDGRQLDEHTLPPDPEACLVPTTIGGAAALWTAREPFLLIDDLGSLVATSCDADTMIPIAGRRAARCGGPRVTLPAGTEVTLANTVQISGGSVILDGTSLALVADYPWERHAAVLALASGRTLRTMALPPGTIRIAARRGLAVIQDALRRFTVVDLRFARHLGVVIADDDVKDFAVDPDGRMLALRLRGGELELAPLDEHRGAAPQLDAPPRETSEGAAVAPGAAARPAASPPDEDRPVESGPVVPRSAEIGPPARPGGALPPVIVDAFEPRPLRDRLPRGDALAALDRELRLVALWTLRAISTAWDTRRLGYGNEGVHPYEHEVAALLGKNAGFAPDYVAAARDALAEHEAALAADPHHRNASTPIAELIDEFGLSPVAVDVLLVIAAPSLDGDVARLYGILGNDPGRAMVDELLVQHILAGRVSRHDVAMELHARAPLVRLGIVDVNASRPRPFAALEVEPVVLDRLRCERPDLGAVPVHADRALDAIELASGVLLSAIEALAHAARPARIAVRGRAGTGRRTLLAAFAHRAGRSLGVIDATVLPADADRFRNALRAALRRTQLAGLFPVIDGLDTVTFDHRNGGEVAHEILAGHPGPLAILCPPSVKPPLPIGHVALELPAISETERLGVWQRALDGTGHWLRDAAGLASRYRVGPGVIHRAIAAVAGHDPLTPCDDRIDAFLRQSRDLRLAGHARRVDRLASWADLVLPPDIMDSLRELVGRVRHRRTVFESWGMGRTMITSRGLTALFQGQPGTGKTLVAGVIARELELDLYQVDLSKVMSKWIGETERNLGAIFDAAEDGQVILLFDEADSLFAKRTEVRSSNDRYANLAVNYLLQRLDSFEGITILTTNSGGSIDPAFKRRLSFRLSFPFPDEDTRAELWRAHLPRELPRAGDLTFDVLAHKYQLSGGYIRNACLRAAFLAAQEETALHQHHLERAVALEFAELGKLSTTGTID